MRKKLPVILIVALILPSAGSTGAQIDNFTSTASLFSVGTGARPLGLGGAFVALADDGNALLYNPAGLTQLSKLNLNSFYSNQFGVVDYGSVSISSKNLGFSYLQLNSGGLAERDLYGNKTGEFSYTSRGLIGAYAKSFGNLSLGLQAKAFSPGFSWDCYGGSLSPGLIYEVRPFTVGAVVKNLFTTDIVYPGDHQEPWASEAVLGIAYKSEGLKVDLDFTAELTEGGLEQNSARAGVEVLLFDYVTARAGITSDLLSSIGISLNTTDFRLDYACSTHEELGVSQRFSIVMRFKGLPITANVKT